MKITCEQPAFNVSTNDFSLPQEIERIHLSGLAELQVLDLSRNNIGRLGVNTFSSLSALTRLDLSLNALRTVCTLRGEIYHGNDYNFARSDPMTHDLFVNLSPDLTYIRVNNRVGEKSVVSNGEPRKTYQGPYMQNIFLVYINIHQSQKSTT